MIIYVLNMCQSHSKLIDELADYLIPFDMHCLSLS